jgi:hypothetical protein
MNENRNSLSCSLLAAAFGAIAGATIVFFSNEKNRQKAAKAISDVNEDAQAKLTELKEVVDKANKQTKGKIAANLKSLAKQLEK